jgi:hypothetical protein
VWLVATDELEKILKEMIIAKLRYYPGIFIEGLDKTS